MDLLRQITRLPGARSLWKSIPAGSIESRVRFGIWDVPAYAYGVYSASVLARSLGCPKISVVEFGDAGGRGLASLESAAASIGAALGIAITVLGFDAGKHLPHPEDYRDLPHVPGNGGAPSRAATWQKQPRRAKVMAGEVGDTVRQVIGWPDLAPIGFVSFDLGNYISTKRAFGIFNGFEETRLPRVFCYFDNVIRPEEGYPNDFVGEMLAINEFNAENVNRKICKISHLNWLRAHAEEWNEQIYVMHDFHHKLYTKDASRESSGGK